MGFVIVGMGLAYGGALTPSDAPLRSRLARSLPLFVVGFLVMALLNTVGALDWLSSKIGRDVVADLSIASRFLIVVALAGVGLGTRLSTLRRAGWRPLLIGLATACVVAVASYGLILWLGPAGGA